MTRGCDVPGPAEARAEQLNRSCFCRTLDRVALDHAFADRIGGAEDIREQMRSRPNLLSSTPVFVAREDVAAVKAVVGAIERVVRLAAYQSAALAWAPEIAHRDYGPLGALMGYDFHLTSDGPRLIEVNTNAGGAFLNARLAEAQRVCCVEAGVGLRPGEAAGFNAAVAGMFRAEWRRQRGSGAPRRIAIVDDAPSTQYLYPEFLLAKAILEASGVEVVIADPQALTWCEGQLRDEGGSVDLVYNRLVDFAFEAPEHAALRAAYEAGAVVVTPNPHVHALRADKRDLVLLSDPARLEAWRLSAEDLAALAAVPRTVLVTPETADELWAGRKAMFFKPTRGHASKGVYRGDKLTTRVWAEIVGGGYIAQAYAQPSERQVEVDGRPVALKLDVRLYTYDGEILLTAARLYQGQTTNMRTPGGGFSPLFVV